MKQLPVVPLVLKGVLVLRLQRILKKVSMADYLLPLFIFMPLTWSQAIADEIVASFDWSVPDRTRVDDHNVLLPIDPNPATWPVSFDACESNPGASITKYHWAFGDGQQTIATSCGGVIHEFPSEGIYTVTLTLTTVDGSTATTSREVTVQDFLILGLGDSYGAGEGSPDVEIEPSLLTRWIELGVDIAQEELERTHAAEILAGVGKLLGPVENLLTAISIQDAIDCSLCSPDGIGEDICFAAAIGAGFPAVCFICKSDCRDAAANVASATKSLAEALVDATKTAGLEYLQDFIDDPTGLKTELNRLKATWNAALSAADALLMTLRGERDAIPGLSRPTWDDKQCHRSSFSAQAQTALAIEAADPKSSVTFVHLACSGAETTDLYTDGYEGIAGSPLPAQLKAAARAVGDREIDALLLSVGGNDANFSSIIFAGITQEPTNDPESPLFTRVDEATLGIPGICALTYFFLDDCFSYFGEANSIGLGLPGLKLYQEGVDGLPEAYRSLNEKILSSFPDIARDSRRVFITQYPNATEDETGTACGPRLERLPGIVDIPGWSSPEWIWAEQTVIPGINSAVSAAANEHGWTFVDGVFSGFEGHGYCSDDNWINRIQQSFARQGDVKGSVHPTRVGYAEIATHVISAVKAQLFSGPSGTPRAPQVHPVADAGPPVVIDEGSSYLLVNNTLDPSRTGGLAFSWSLAINPTSGASLSSTTTALPTLFALDDATGVLNLSVTNAFGRGSASTPVLIRNVAPVVNVGGDLRTFEGTPIQIAARFVDPGLADTHVAHIDWGDLTSADMPVTVGVRKLSGSHTYRNQGEFTVQVTARDDDGGEGKASVHISVANLPPVMGPLTGPARPTSASTMITVSAPFTDPGVLDRHSAIAIWGDGTTSPATVVEYGGAGTVSASHGYTRPGSHEVTLVVTDDAGGSAAVMGRFITMGPPVK